MRRLQQSASSVASAVAGGGANVQSTSNVVSTGPPASGVSQAIVFAPPGKSVTVVCDVYAKNTNEYKTCYGAAQAASAASEPVAWESAPPCNRTQPSAGVKDNKGNLWGYENRSCAIHPAGTPPTYPPATANASASANASAFAAISFAAAPPCAPGDPSTGVRDTAGRFWGFQNGTSCAYKDPSGNAILPAPINPPANATAAGVPAALSPSPAPAPAPVPPPATPSPSPAAAPSTATAAAEAQAKAGAGRRRSAV